jgi:hypothetical protein
MSQIQGKILKRFEELLAVGSKIPIGGRDSRIAEPQHFILGLRASSTCFMECSDQKARIMYALTRKHLVYQTTISLTT